MIRSKFVKLSMSNLKQVSYSSNYTLFIIVMAHNSYVNFNPIRVLILTHSSALVKICHIPHVIFKPQVSFSSNFASLFIVMGDNSSVFFFVKYYILCTKGITQLENLENFLSFLKQQISFSSHFAYVFSFMRCNSPLHFCLNFIYFHQLQTQKNKIQSKVLFLREGHIFESQFA